MHGEGFFYQAFMYLLAAVVSVPIAKRLGLGSVLGYLIAGIVIGPFGLGLIGEEGQDVMHFAEFGVVMMLFLVGLELEPMLLWRMRGPVLGLGGLQVLASTLLLAGVAVAAGLGVSVALAVGMILALSSTAIVLQTLSEKGWMKTGGGQSAFAVLLFQDIAVIPMLALMPLLAAHEPGGHGAGDAAHGTAFVDTLPGWLAGIVVLGSLAGLILGGRFLVRPAFRFIAKTRLRETFTAAALLMIIATALLMTQLGLSPALGTFVAGVVLATSEYKHELESEIEPFKGLLLGLFFIAVGASIDFGLIAERPVVIAAIVFGLMVLKFLVLAVLGRVFKMGVDHNMLFAFALAQGGEFAFVLFSFATQHSVIPQDVAATLVASVALSMALTPLVMIVYERLVMPRVGTRESDSREADAIEEDNPVIIAGYGRFGQIVGRLLMSSGLKATVLDVDADQVDLLRRFGQRVYYGDASRHDLLESAGAASAKVLVLAMDEPEKVLELVHTARKHFPNLTLFARARGRREAFDLIEAGVDHVFRETLDTSLRVGVEVMRALGFRAYQAHRASRTFRRMDEKILVDTIEHRHDQKALTSFVRQGAAELERVMAAQVGNRAEDPGWDAASLREAAKKRAERQRQ